MRFYHKDHFSRTAPQTSINLFSATSADINTHCNFSPSAPNLRRCVDTHDDSAAAVRPLGNDANIVGRPVGLAVLAAAAVRRGRLLRLLSDAQSLLIRADVRGRQGGAHRTRRCHRVRQHGAENVVIRLNDNPAESAASLSGVQTCGSVWACPVCAARIAVDRGRALKTALAWADGENLYPVMVTLTARHDRSMALAWLKTRFAGAWRHFQQGRAWRAARREFSIAHTVAAREVLYGDNGWHYHMHILAFIPRPALAAATGESLQAALRSPWLDSLSKLGLSGVGDYALTVSAHGDVPAHYLSKLGIAAESATDVRYELTGAGNKQGRQGVNVWTLLARAGGHSPAAQQSGRLYVEYARAMQGDNWITWGRGLAAACGVADVSDDELAAADETPELSPWLVVPDNLWRLVALSRQYAGLLQVAALTRSRPAVLAWLAELAEDTPAAIWGISPHAPVAAVQFAGSSPPAAAAVDSSRPGKLANWQTDRGALLSRLSRLQANREFIRRLLRAKNSQGVPVPVHLQQELTWHDRALADLDAALESLESRPCPESAGTRKDK